MSTKSQPPRVASKAPERSKRVWAWLRGGLLAAVLIVGLGYAGRVLEAYVRRAPVFALREIRVEGQRRVSEATVRTLAELAPGQNIFSVDLDRAQQALRAHPWIAEAQLTRHLPASLHIRVQEKRPLAYLARPKGLVLIATDGSVLESYTGQALRKLPVLTLASQSAGDLGLEPSAAKAVRALLRACHKVDLGRHLIESVHWAREDATLFLGSPPMEVRLGQRPYDRKLARLAKVLGTTRRHGRRIERVDLANARHPDRVAITLSGPAPVLAVSSQPR